MITIKENKPHDSHDSFGSNRELDGYIKSQFACL